MDADNRYCLGCYRTLGEVARWGEMTDAERSRVLARLAARRIEETGPVERAAPGKSPAR